MRLRSIQGDRGGWIVDYEGFIEFDIRVDESGQAVRLEYIDDEYSGAIKTIRRE